MYRNQQQANIQKGENTRADKNEGNFKCGLGYRYPIVRGVSGSLAHHLGRWMSVRALDERCMENNQAVGQNFS